MPPILKLMLAGRAGWWSVASAFSEMSPDIHFGQHGAIARLARRLISPAMSPHRMHDSAKSYSLSSLGRCNAWSVFGHYLIPLAQMRAIGYWYRNREMNMRRYCAAGWRLGLFATMASWGGASHSYITMLRPPRRSINSPTIIPKPWSNKWVRQYYPWHDGERWCSNASVVLAIAT